MAVDHIFTDPSGREHVVTGPDGSTRDQAFAILQTQIGQQTGRPYEPTVGEKATQYLGDTAMGAMHGAQTVMRGVASLPKLVGLPPIGGQRRLDQLKADYDSLKNDPRTYKAATGFTDPRTPMYSVGQYGTEYGLTSAVPVGNFAKLPLAKAALEGMVSGGMTGEGNWSDLAWGAAGGAGTNAALRYGGRIAAMHHSPQEARFLRRSLSLLGGAYAAESLGMGHGVSGALGTYVLLGTPAGRRMLMGDTHLQRALAQALARNPSVGGRIGGLVTSGLAQPNSGE